MTTQVKAIAGKASTAIPAGGVYANDTIARHDPGSLAEDYAELVSCRKKGPAEVARVVSSRRRRRRQEEQQVAVSQRVDPEGVLQHLSGRRAVLVDQGECKTEEGSKPNVVMVENWFEELKRLVPAD